MTTHYQRSPLAMTLQMSVLVICATLSSCAGIGANYSTPATAQQIPFTVEPVTPGLVAKLAVKPAPAATPPIGSLKAEEYAYRIGSTDVLSIFINQSLYSDQAAGTVDRQTESLYVVDEGGFIFLPLHGALKVSGLTIGQAYAEIQRALTKFITRPQINVRLAEFRSQRLAVAGEVIKPGYQPITDRPITITEAVIAAGQNAESDLRKATLKRGGKEYSIDVFALIKSPDFGHNWVLQDGDVVFVQKNENRVYVLGEAPNRTQLIDPYATSLAEVLISSSQQQIGIRGEANYLQNGASSPSSIFVIRGNVDSVRVFHLNGSSPEAFILADKFQLASGDIIYVSTREITRFNRYVAQLLPTLQSLLSPALIINTLSR